MCAKRVKKPNKKEMIKKILIYLFLLVYISIAIYSGIKIFNWFRENRKSRNIVKEINQAVSINEEDNSINIDFSKLKEQNSDTVAWIKVNGTAIEYPVVKAKNNYYYLTHSFDKSYNTAGWAFMDYKNKLDGEDKNIIIYAHNRKDGSMFGTLKNILSKEWEENEDYHIIPLITENGNEEYQVFSVYRIEDEDYYITTNFKNDAQYEKFLNTIKNRSLKDFGIDISSSDHILTLSTCSDNNKYRVVLHAKKIKK